MHFENSEQLNRWVAERQDGTTLLAFSCGKDSIAAWLEMKKYFHTIVPVYHYLVPGLEFVERSLAYYEDFFETRIIRMPSPSLYRLLNAFAFQAPENLHIIDKFDLPDFTTENINDAVRADLGLNSEIMCANGVRAVDSPHRWLAVKTHGPVNLKKKSYMSVFDWRIKRLRDELEAAGVKLPVDYQMFGRSFDGIDYRFLAPIKEHFPDDYERILHFFPLAELELKRAEFRGVAA